jgi:hypothetical protein
MGSDAMFRLINIADALIDYGFEFDDESITMTQSVGLLRGHGRHLIQRMLNILRIENNSPSYSMYMRAFQHTGLEAWLLFSHLVFSF